MRFPFAINWQPHMYGNAADQSGALGMVAGSYCSLMGIYIQYKMRFFDPRAWVEGAKAQWNVPNLQWFGAGAGSKDDVLANAIR